MDAVERVAYKMKLIVLARAELKQNTSILKEYILLAEKNLMLPF
jgi:hypothetical protein